MKVFFANLMFYLYNNSSSGVKTPGSFGDLFQDKMHLARWKIQQLIIGTIFKMRTLLKGCGHCE
jgi:hypothetical protein